jgi:hypothetical protein
MKKPILSNYSYTPNYTSISTCYDYEKYSKDLNIYIEHLEKQLLLHNVSSMFSAKQMEQAYNDGVEAEQQRCCEFNIENYR